MRERESRGWPIYASPTSRCLLYQTGIELGSYMSTERSYAIVLKDLEDRQRRCQEQVKRFTEELNSITQMITGLRQFILPSQDLPLSQSVQFTNGLEPEAAVTEKSGMYSGLSTRWAILYLLAENTTIPMGRSEIAKALTDGGIMSNAQSFASNVSAVLSGMANERKEVEQVESGYQITDHGREVWQGVKRTPQWNARTAYPAMATG